jgi:predicted acylesterase/phospholipase RssA
MIVTRPYWPLLLAAAAATAGACAHRATPKLDAYDLNAGYRFERLAASAVGQPPKNSDDVFVVLAFSGGGTRAAALSTGVLYQLNATTFRLNPTTGEPCADGDPGCEATARSLLNEVDVISSVSGGSFTAAAYALYGQEMLDRQSAFQSRFLYYPLQRDLFSQAVFYPQNWQYLGARTEIAAKLYDGRVFDGATYQRLEQRPRPYVILNGTDATTGARFEFNQEQFDLLCSNLSQVPIARGVTGSSAFPGLLNSIAIDSHNKQGCGYAGPGSGAADDWVKLGLQDRSINQTRYRAAQGILAYRDPNRTTLHVLDGGLADNIGLRSVIQALESTDRPIGRKPDGSEALGGWSLLSMINNRKIKTLIVITANARTKHDSDADTRTGGPSTFGVLGAASGIPMGNYSTDTLEQLQSTLRSLVEPTALASLKTLAIEVSFEDLPDNASQADSERHFFQNLPTSFELQPFEVDCLIDRGARLLRDASSVGQDPPRTYADFVRTELRGESGTAAGPQEPVCTDQVARTKNGIRAHYIDVGFQYGASIAGSGDVEDAHGPGVAVRITRPNGLSAIVDYGTQSFDMTSGVTGSPVSPGQVKLRTLLGGIAYTRRLAQLEATAGFALGYGFGSFELADDARDAFGREGIFGIETDATNALVLAPRVSLWQNLSNRWATGVTATYYYSNPTVELRSGEVTRTQAIDASAVRVSAGLAFKVF